MISIQMQMMKVRLKFFVNMYIYTLSIVIYVLLGYYYDKKVKVLI